MISKDRGVSGKLKLVPLLVAAMVLLAFSVNLPAHAQSEGSKAAKSDTAQRKSIPINVKGPVQAIWPETRKIKVDGITYILAEDLVVRNKKGVELPKYKLEYFRYAHLVAFTAVHYVIRDITILENAS